MSNRKYSSEREEKLLEEIKAKLMADLGILVWGTIVKTAQGDYRVILVDDDGKLLASS